MGNGISVESGARGSSAAACLPKDPNESNSSCATIGKIKSAYAENKPLPPATSLTGEVYNREVAIEWKNVVPLGLPKPQSTKDTP